MLPYPFDRLRTHTPLAPVVRERGVWTYRAEPPTDCFTREALAKAWMAYYTNCGPRPDVLMTEMR